MYVTTTLGDRVLSKMPKFLEGRAEPADIHNVDCLEAVIKYFLANKGEPLSESDASDKNWEPVLEGMIDIGLIAKNSPET